MTELISQIRLAKGSIKNAKKVPAPQIQAAAPNVIYILNSINSCWEKLQKYYALIDESPVYAAAIALNPEHKLDYFKINWEDHLNWIKQTEESIEDLWRIMYKDCANSIEGKTAVNHAVDSSLFLPSRL